MGSERKSKEIQREKSKIQKQGHNQVICQTRVIQKLELARTQSKVKTGKSNNKRQTTEKYANTNTKGKNKHTKQGRGQKNTKITYSKTTRQTKILTRMARGLSILRVNSFSRVWSFNIKKSRWHFIGFWHPP